MNTGVHVSHLWALIGFGEKMKKKGEKRKGREKGKGEGKIAREKNILKNDDASKVK